MFTGLILAGTTKALLLLLLNYVLPDVDLEKWLSNDGFKKGAENDASKKYLFDELKRLKDKLRYDLMYEKPVNPKTGEYLNLLEIYKQVEGRKIQIDKVRLMIENKIIQAEHIHQPTKVIYVVFRAYWINNNGKKERKFSKSIGAKDKVVINDKVKEHAAKELELMMWEQYKLDYPEI
jgi:hypothetical protein